MKDVILNEIIKEEVVDKEIVNAYYNICKYYNKDTKTIKDFIKIKRGK